MANILQVINNSYKRMAKNFEQISLIFFFMAIGFFAITFVNQGSRKTTDNTFLCEMTPIDEVLTLDTSTLKTVRQLSLINVETELFQTSLSKNEVPAIENPRFSESATISLCTPQEDPVLIVKYNDIIKIYPRQILEKHIVVNDMFAKTPLLITYSPLTEHYAVYIRDVNDKELVFGVSGLLYKNSDLLFDSRTESLWSQLDGKVLVGSLIGAYMEQVNSIEVSTLSKAIQNYPEALYMNYDTGFRLDYAAKPFEEYRSNNKVIEDVEFYSNEYEPKQIIWAFVINDTPFHTYLEANGSYEFNVSGQIFKIIKQDDLVTLTDQSNKSYSIFPIYWFVWYDNYPKSIDPLKNE
jgi:hypothetical protein